MSLFVTCAQGLEALLLEELQELGISGLRAGFRGVFVDQFDMPTIYLINYCSRIGSRVLLPMSRFRCRNKETLYAAVKEINWRPFFGARTTFAIDANVHHPLLRNSLFAAQIAKDAICDQLRLSMGQRPTVDLKAPDIQLNLFIHKQEAVLSFDTSGQSLHKRGYRLEAGEAPLQESLAAALLRLSNFSGNEPVLDPCCGSGTLLIEAALIASNTAPGYLRKTWGFTKHPDFAQEVWLKVKNEVDSRRLSLPSKSFTGLEVSSDVARICRANLKAAGFLDAVEIIRTDFADYTPSKPHHLLLTNPPHGIRMSDIDPLRTLYRRLGDFMKHKLAKPAKAFVFIGNLELTKEVGLAAKRRHVLHSGGLEARLLEFDIY